MTNKKVKGSAKLGISIKKRRAELNLTIEEAASKAGVGTKTWSRYEAGGSIRKDKTSSVMKVLAWHTLPIDDENDDDNFDICVYKNSGVWSKYLADRFGDLAAISFVIGSDILSDNISQDLEALSSMARGTHIGQLGASWLELDLPRQFIMRYDYEFLYTFQSTVNRLRLIASAGGQLIAHSVLEEIALYLIVESSRILIESFEPHFKQIDSELYEYWDEWAFDLFDDMDVVTCLYSGDDIDQNHIYHFEHWKTEQFYTGLV